MSKEIGSRGERLVAEYLEKKNYMVLAKNYRSTRGEIDIVARSSVKLAFIEVKTMLHSAIENLRFLIDEKKRSRIAYTAKKFLLEHKEYNDMQISFDVAVLKTNPFWDIEPEIIYIEDAFGDIDDK